VHLRVSAPAKVNLSLLVGPRRADGYHELFTVFAPIGVVDELEFELIARPPDARPRGARPPGARSGGRRGDLHVRCAGAAGESNLAARALRALENATGWTIAGIVTVEKGIPIGAGLGGGSSDAAVALRAGVQAVAEAGGPIPDDASLRAIAREVGADVPFFLNARCSIGRGIGDVLEPLRLPILDIVVVFIARHLSTPRVYKAFDVQAAEEDFESFVRRAEEAGALWKRLARDWDGGAIAEGAVATRVAALLQNDLEKASFSLLPLLEQTRKAMLERRAPGVLMSGSGSTLFAVCRSGDEAEDLARRLGAAGLSARPTTTGWGPDLP